MTDEIDLNAIRESNNKSEVLKKSLAEYTLSLNDTIIKVQDLYLKFNPASKYDSHIENNLYKPMCNFSRLVNLGIKTLINDLYKTTSDPKSFKNEVYAMLDGLKLSRNGLLAQVEGELDAAKREPYMVNQRPVDFGEDGLNYNPLLLQAIGKLLPSGDSTAVSENLEKMLRQVNRFTT